MWMFVAAQHQNDFGNDYYIGAFAPTRRVFNRCNNSRHCGYRTLPAADCVFGSYWYCVSNWSFGFSAHNQVRLCSATPSVSGVVTETVATTNSRGTCTTGTPVAGVLAGSTT